MSEDKISDSRLFFYSFLKSSASSDTKGEETPALSHLERTLQLLSQHFVKDAVKEVWFHLMF